MKKITIFCQVLKGEESVTDLAIKQVMGTLCPSINVELAFVKNSNEADIVLVGTRKRLNEFFNEQQMFILLPMEKHETATETNNVKVFNPTSFVEPMLEFLKTFVPAGKEIAPDMVKTSVWYSATSQTVETRRILVVDDKRENLETAYQALIKHDNVILAASYGEAMEIIGKEKLDAVLTDCQMHLCRLGQTALSDNAYGPDEQGHVGLFLLMQATMRGIPTALLTDANHHRDWVVALIEQLRGQDQTMNGQPVRFYNNKQWDVAADALLRAKNLA